MTEKAESIFSKIRNMIGLFITIILFLITIISVIASNIKRDAKQDLTIEFHEIKIDKLEKEKANETDLKYIIQMISEMKSEQSEMFKEIKTEQGIIRTDIKEILKNK